jgi:hypothetical protein
VIPLFRFPNFQPIHSDFKWSFNTNLDLVAPDLSDADPELNATVIDDENFIDLPGQNKHCCSLRDAFDLMPGVVKLPAEYDQSTPRAILVSLPNMMLDKQTRIRPTRSLSAGWISLAPDKS